VASSEWTVERHLETGSERGRFLWHELAAIVSACGEHSLSVAKTTITFKGPKRGFAGARPKGDELVGYFDVTYRVEDPRIRSASPYQTDLFVHHFRVDAIDEEFARWIRDSYDQVGCGRRDSVAGR
jgi:hypothetical protein